MTHSELVKALVKPGEDILKALTPEQAHLLHMAAGICGEAGELMDAIKKRCIYQQGLDVANVLEELGDLSFYAEGIMQTLGFTREQVLEYNIAKLTQRYGEKYSDQAAKERKDKQ